MPVVYLGILDLWNDIGSLFGDLLNKAGEFGKWVLSMFPDSPFTFLSTMGQGKYKQYFAFANYFCNFGGMCTILETWLSVIIVYYLWQLIARWVKMIQ